MADNKGAIELGGGKEPDAPEVTESMKTQIETRVRAKLKKDYMGVQFLAFDAFYGSWFSPQGGMVTGWAGVFITRGILLGGPENNISVLNIWGGIPTDAAIDEAIRQSCETHRMAVAQMRAQMNGQGPQT